MDRYLKTLFGVWKVMLWIACMGYSSYQVIFQDEPIAILMFFVFLTLLVIEIRDLSKSINHKE